MRKLFYALTLLIALVAVAPAQTFRVGAFAGYTTAPDHESPNLFQDTRRLFPGVTASAEFPFAGRFTFKVTADASRTPQLPSLFTTDEGEHKPSAEVRVFPQFEAQFGAIFGAFGADSFYHFIPNPEHEEYSRSYGINPAATVGARGKGNEASFTYLFRDKGTDLYGYRVNFFRDLPGGFRAGFEANRLWYKERNREGYVDPYYETDNVFKFSFVKTFGGKK